jgi:hypothetical protein
MTVRRAPSPFRRYRRRFFPLTHVESLETRTLLSSGPLITKITPTEVETPTFDHVDLTFNEAIDPTSFTTADVSLAGPPGAGSPTVTGVTELSSTVYRVSFGTLTVRGTYQIAVGPNISDPSGHLMDQNQNGTGGETPGDQFAAPLEYVNATTIFKTNTVIHLGDTTYDGQDIAIDKATVTIDGPHSFDSVQLINGAILTHSANTATQTHDLDLTVTHQVIVDASSKIDVSAKGYLPGRTTGNATAGASTGNAGGSFGGLGGAPSGVANAVYGDLTHPADWGSGGGGTGGGAGGGLVQVHAAALQLDGQILALGANANGRSDGGAGSGGGVVLDLGSLAGTGLIRAAGGDGVAPFGNASGGGGGGRIALFAQDFAGFDTARITAEGGLSTNAAYPAGAGSVYLFHGPEPTRVLSYTPPGNTKGYVTDLNTIIISFTRDIDPASADEIVIDGQEGRITPSGLTRVAARTYRLDLPVALDQNGPYHFTVLPALQSVEGYYLDQNGNGITNEPDDTFTWSLNLDSIPPYVSHQDPAGDVAGTISSVNVWFSEAIDPATFTTADVTIVKPDGTNVAATGIQNVGLNEFRISFPAQTLVGTYHVKIGPNVTDLAGNGLDENGNGVGGEASDVYDGTFNLVNVDLGLSNVQVQPTQLWAGETATVSWSGQNLTGLPL